MNQFKKLPQKRLLEKHIEARLVCEVKKLGGMCEKFTSTNKRSVPDRLCLFPGGLVWFVECKAPGKKATPLQLEDHGRRLALGMYVTTVSTYEEVDALIKMIDSGGYIT